MMQQADALARANANRLTRGRLRREVYALTTAQGRARLIELLDRREPAIQTMSLDELLAWPRFCHRSQVNAALRPAGIMYPGRLVRELTDRQILALCDALQDQIDTHRRKVGSRAAARERVAA